MTAKVVFARETDDIQQAQASMLALSVRHVPVTRNGLVVGILSNRDILLHTEVGPTGGLKVPPKKVQDIMSQPVVTCRKGDSIGSCVESLLRHRISCLPVVNSAGKLLGLVTTTDLLQLLHDEDYEPGREIPFDWDSVPLLRRVGMPSAHA